MLTIYRRHEKRCKFWKRAEALANPDRVHLSGDVFVREGQSKCLCPLWVGGTARGREIRQSLTTRNLEKATENALRLGDKGAAPRRSVSIAEACDKFLADARAQKLRERTVYKYGLLFRHLKAFAASGRMTSLKELDTQTLTDFRATWKDRNLAALKKLERLRSFCRFAQRNGWLEENPADSTKIRNPKVTTRPTLPFTRDEMMQILAGVATRIAKCQAHGRPNARRLRGLVLLLRYSGLRIGDAVSCSIDRLVNGKLRLYTQKTGTHVHCPLPEFVVKELAAIPRMSDRFWFWSGNGNLETAVKDWQGRLKEIFDFESEEDGKKITKIQNGHAHRFRDTFATELLLAGVPLERVSILLGHSSVKITERHYAPWVRERQEQAEADVRRTWSQDPIALLESDSASPRSMQ
jgi:integrase/recombinase XerD